METHPRCDRDFLKRFEAYEEAATAHLESLGKGKDAKGYGTIIMGIEDVKEGGITFATYETWPMGGHEDGTIFIEWSILNPVEPDGLGRVFK